MPALSDLVVALTIGGTSVGIEWLGDWLNAAALRLRTTSNIQSWGEIHQLGWRFWASPGTLCLTPRGGAVW